MDNNAKWTSHVQQTVWLNQRSSIQDKTFEIEARPDILDYFFSDLHDLGHKRKKIKKV